MPRSHPIARLTVDRSRFSRWHWGRPVADWLNYRAEEIESEPNCFSLRDFRARMVGGRGNTCATLRIGAAGCLSLETRKRIAKWLRSRARHLRNPNAVFEGRWFTQEFGL